MLKKAKKVKKNVSKSDSPPQGDLRHRPPPPPPHKPQFGGSHKRNVRYITNQFFARFQHSISKIPSTRLRPL